MRCYHEVICSVHVPHNRLYTVLYLSSCFSHHSCSTGNPSSSLMLLQRVKKINNAIVNCKPHSHFASFSHHWGYGESRNDNGHKTSKFANPRNFSTILPSDTGENNVWMIGGEFLTLLSSASIFRSSVDLFLCLAKFLNVSSRMLAACGREG